MEFEDLVEGWEDSPLLPLVAMWRTVRPVLADPASFATAAAAAALMWGLMWALSLWACM